MCTVVVAHDLTVTQSAPIGILAVSQEDRYTREFLLQLLYRHRHGPLLNHPVPVWADPNAGCEPAHYLLTALCILPKTILLSVLKQVIRHYLNLDDEFIIASIDIDFPVASLTEFLAKDEPNAVCEECFVVIFPAAHSSSSFFMQYTFPYLIFFSI